MSIFNFFEKNKSIDAKSKQDINDLIGKINKINGWLAPEAAYFTACLLDYQKQLELSGNIIEIGVFHGKYLALLYQYIDRKNEYIFGIDAFIGATDIDYAKKYVLKNLFNIFQDNQHLTIIAQNSLDLTSSNLLEITNGKNARFISIDGGHTSDVVFHDLHLSTSLLKKGGVIAMDDIFNHSLPGVTEALFEFFLKEDCKILAPFAHCYNKLFLTTPDFYEAYFEKSFKILENMSHFDTFQRTKARIDENLSVGFSPELFGYEVLCFL